MYVNVLLLICLLTRCGVAKHVIIIMSWRPGWGQRSQITLTLNKRKYQTGRAKPMACVCFEHIVEHRKVARACRRSPIKSDTTSGTKGEAWHHQQCVMATKRAAAITSLIGAALHGKENLPTSLCNPSRFAPVLQSSSMCIHLSMSW